MDRREAVGYSKQIVDAFLGEMFNNKSTSQALDSLEEEEYKELVASLERSVAEVMCPDFTYDRIIVVNKHKLDTQLKPGYVQVYIGRPSEYGNPFVLGEQYKRGEAVEAYRELAHEEDYKYPKLMEMLRAGKHIALVCFCKQRLGDDRPCHGDVIKERLHAQMMEEYL